MCPGPRPEQPRRHAHGPGGLEAAARRGSIRSGAAPSAAVALDGGRVRRVGAGGWWQWAGTVGWCRSCSQEPAPSPCSGHSCTCTRLSQSSERRAFGHPHFTEEEARGPGRAAASDRVSGRGRFSPSWPVPSLPAALRDSGGRSWDRFGGWCEPVGSQPSPALGSAVPWGPVYMGDPEVSGGPQGCFARGRTGWGAGTPVGASVVLERGTFGESVPSIPRPDSGQAVTWRELTELRPRHRQTGVRLLGAGWAAVCPRI